MRSRPRSARFWLAQIGFLLVLSVQGWSAEVVATARTPRIDGDLQEWGAPQRIPIAPGGKQVGLRGVFRGKEDHEVDLYLMWDADFLYVAVVVEDDTMDVARVGPEESVWEGPGGQRKDKMFYYDHLKVFLRGKDAPLGYNMWIAPSQGEQGPYIWGTRQWGEASEDVPVQVGSAWVPGIYTYELAVPWEWLEIYPQTSMELDAMFLLPDADLPGLALGKKIEKDNNWIWWKGKIQLQGKPPGLKPPPASIVERIAEGVKAFQAPVPKGRANSKAEQQAAVPEESKVVRDEAAIREATDTTRGAGADVVQAASVPTPKIPDVRRLLAKKNPGTVPDWVYGLNDEVSRAQAAAYFRQLTRTLYRLNGSKVDSRIDVLILDMAESAGTWRRQARVFLIELLGRLLEDLQQPEGPARLGLGRAAREAGVEEERVVILVEHVCARAKNLYEENKVKNTDELLQEGSRKAGLSAAQVRELIRLLLQEWVE